MHEFLPLAKLFEIAMRGLLLPIFVLMLAATSLFGQMERTFYQSYDIDSVKSVTLNIPQDFEIYAWAGNTILIETHIQLFEASPTLLDFFIKQKRYEINMVKGSEAATLTPFQPERKPIKTAHGECTEVVTTKIFVPDTFDWPLEDKQHLTLKPQSN